MPVQDNDIELQEKQQILTEIVRPIFEGETQGNIDKLVDVIYDQFQKKKDLTEEEKKQGKKQEPDNPEERFEYRRELAYIIKNKFDGYQKKKIEYGASDDTQPHGILIGGQMAAGKGGLTFDTVQQYKKRKIPLIEIDADELRTKHPKYGAFIEEFGDRELGTKTQPFASGCVAGLTAATIAMGHSFLMDSSMRDANWDTKFASDLTNEEGYRVIVKVLAVNENVSKQALYCRFEDQKEKGVGRLVPEFLHDGAYAGVLKTTKSLDDNKAVAELYVHIRESPEPVFSQELVDNEWERSDPNRTAAEVLDTVREQPKPIEELVKQAERQKKIYSQMRKRGASAAEYDNPIAAWKKAKPYFEKTLSLRGQPGQDASLHRKFTVLDAEIDMLSAGIKVLAQNETIKAKMSTELVRLHTDLVEAKESLQNTGQPFPESFKQIHNAIERARTLEVRNPENNPTLYMQRIEDIEKHQKILEAEKKKLLDPAQEQTTILSVGTERPKSRSNGR